MKYKYNRKLGKAICKNCNIEFEKPLSEIKRNSDLGRPNYCSRSCVGKDNHVTWRSKKKSNYDISIHSGSRKDEYSMFKYTLNSAKRRFKELNITLHDLKEQWELQNGLCPYTMIQLQLPRYNSKVDIKIRASLDRIDSSKGYVKGNIQFVSTPINYMKSTMSHEETVEFLKQISKNYISCHQED